MIFAEDGDMMFAFFKNMDKIFSTMGFVYPTLRKVENPLMSGFCALNGAMVMLNLIPDSCLLTYYLAGDLVICLMFKMFSSSTMSLNTMSLLIILLAELLRPKYSISF